MKVPMETKIAGLFKTSDSDNYIFGKEKDYIIPEYQREYSWGESQIESFVASIRHALAGESVFMGTVQFACTSENPHALHVIDGQQRMTTFLLFCNLVEKKAGKNILSSNNMSLDIRNFESNKGKLDEALRIEYKEADNGTSNNRYLENTKLLKASIEDLIQENYTADQITESIYKNIYFVELITKDIPLPQVVGIFNTINTTGLDLNCSDLFKLQYYEYLKKKDPDNDSLMKQICNIYERVNKENKSMNNILDIYKHCIVAKYKLGYEMLSKSNETFFDEIFGKKEPENNAEILSFKEFEKIVEIYIELSEAKYDIESLNSFADDVIWITRYGRYWTIPYAAAYFNGKNYENALDTAIDIAKYLIVCSVDFDKAINPVHTFICNEILPRIGEKSKIEDKIKSVICKSPYDWQKTPEKTPDWNKTEFVNRIKSDLCRNKKRTFIICYLSALLEECSGEKDFSKIRSKLCDWKNFQYDIEHICAYSIIKDSPDKEEFNGIGNLVVLNRSINRSIGDKDVKDKVKEYKNSSKYEKEPKFISVLNVAEQIERNNGVWGIEQVRERQKEQEKLLCDFLWLT